MKYKHQERWPPLACNQTGRSLSKQKRQNSEDKTVDDLKAKKFPDVEFQQRELQERNKGRATKEKAKKSGRSASMCLPTCSEGTNRLNGGTSPAPSF
jgi:hypothetical protein